MNIEQIFMALEACGSEPSIKLSLGAKWYVDCLIEIHDDGTLIGGAEYRGTPEDAVGAYWRSVSEATPERGKHILCRGKRIYWNGFMWAEHRIQAERAPATEGGQS